jgi:hypothetical protein
MQANILYALVVIGAITAGTIGFANTLTVSAINPIGGNDGAVDSPTSGTITAVTWTEISTADGDIDIDEALVTVDNADVSGHTYEVCAVVSDGVSVTSGLVVCVTTALIAAGGNSIETLDLPTDVDTATATQIYITLEELS